MPELGPRNQKETMLNHKIPNNPWWKIASDIFEWENQHYLVLVDYCSDWIEYDIMENQTAQEAIKLMQKQFARWGYPHELITDSGKNYDSRQLAKSCKKKEICH